MTEPLPWPASMDVDSPTNFIALGYATGELLRHHNGEWSYNRRNNHAELIVDIKVNCDKAGVEVRNLFIELYLTRLITR